MCVTHTEPACITPSSCTHRMPTARSTVCTQYTGHVRTTFLPSASPTLSCSTRSMRYLHRGLMSLRISAVMMSMPLDSCVTMQVWQKAVGGPAQTPQNPGGPEPAASVSPPQPLGPHIPTPTLPRSWALAHLVLMAGALAVLRESLQGLGDEAHVVLIDVEPQQPQAPGGAAAHDV